MARIKKIVRSNTVSQFRQVAPDGGAAFRIAADVMNEAYKIVAPVAEERMKQEGSEWGREQGRRPVGGLNTGGAGADTLSLIRGFEGFRETPYWDVNAHRVGYGSDTITQKDGTVRRVAKGDRVSREDAERDLARRVSSEFIPIARNAIGAERFDAMPENQKAAITSIAYNYGEIPDRIVGALRSGDDTAAAEAIRGLASDNDGINEKRRNREADVFLSGGAGQSGMAFSPDQNVTIQQADGSFEVRKYSPFSHPILQAHDAAAKVAFQAEMTNKGMSDLLNLSNEYATDPEGFSQAAQSYIDQVVEQAPSEIKGDLSSSLSSVAQRRLLGVQDAKHRNIRERASNSAWALVERWSGEYSQAIASGDQQLIDETQRNLDSALQAYEALPGGTFTAEQSANVFLKAERQGQKSAQSARNRELQGVKSNLTTAIGALKDGIQPGDTASLFSDPDAQENFPSLVAEASAWDALNQYWDEFDDLTFDEQDEIASQALDALAERDDIPEKYEVEIAQAISKRASANREAGEKQIRIAETQEMLGDSSVSWNPYSSEERSRVDEAYKASLGNEEPLSDNGISRAITIAQTTGYVPKSSFESVRYAVNGEDPLLMARALEFAGQTVQVAPNAFSVYGNSKEVLNALSDYSFYGRYMPGEEAAMRMIETSSPEAIERRQNLDRAATQAKKSLSVDDLVNHLDAKDIEVDTPEGDAANAMMADYERLFEDAFMATGNSNVAKNRALDDLARVYGPSGIDGSQELMRYPPTQFYNPVDGSFDWMRSQLERDVTTYVNGEVLDMGEDTRNWLGFGREGVITSDRISLIPDAKTQQDIAAGRSPSYSVMFLDEDDVLQVMPDRYRFEQEVAPPPDYRTLSRQRATDAERRNVRAWRHYLSSDPDRTMSDGEIVQELENNIVRYSRTQPPEDR